MEMLLLLSRFSHQPVSLTGMMEFSSDQTARNFRYAHRTLAGLVFQGGKVRGTTKLNSSKKLFAVKAIAAKRIKNGKNCDNWKWKIILPGVDWRCHRVGPVLGTVWRNACSEMERKHVGGSGGCVWKWHTSLGTTGAWKFITNSV